jgi:DNA-binding response OmpR family regulator
MPSSRTLVVVENESLLRDLIARSLEAVGFDVTTAANASDAKRACKAVDPDACIVDIEVSDNGLVTNPEATPGYGTKVLNELSLN